MEDWVCSFEPNEQITIIDRNTWERTQDKRKQRGDKYIKKLEHKDVNVIRRNDGMLALIDVLHCGYCGCKMGNGSRYNYWTIKDTGEKRASKIAIYKCQNAWQGVPHNKVKQFRADRVEPIIFEAIAQYIEKLQENEDVFKEIEKNQNKEKRAKEKELEKEKQELEKILIQIETMEDNIPQAMTGEYVLSLEELVAHIRKRRERKEDKEREIKQKQEELVSAKVSLEEWEELKKKIPTWKQVVLNADVATKRVLVNRLIERIDIKKDEIVVRFKINLDDFLPQPRISGGSDTIPCKPGLM